MQNLSISDYVVIPKYFIWHGHLPAADGAERA